MTDEAICRQYAAQQVGLVPPQAAVQSVLSSAAAGTVLGAAAGAALGAAAGWLQWRYDIAYAQCMYAKGNQVPGFPTPAPPPLPPPPPTVPPSR